MRDATHCIFCKIVAGEIPATKIYEDNNFICIRDLHPQAKVHCLVIPKKHAESLATLFPAQIDVSASVDLIGNLFHVGTQIARQEGLLPGGFRAVINTDKNGGQTVFHLHLHILGGELLQGSFA